ncbi:endolytic transglycosylase MltG [Helicobacter cappadocius]|uniref:Endolytic murein transglycosylase n=1 Tax=Helicobacter cappadocius TaxID=3063998 RepID=A0AA90PTI7_9HELI|nr:MULTISPECIES: endolytic transglycosylase MltG [unclassified Helicobacter]MDO7252613.1 endolytic transglycosylase MltG [Helicobacter sp. faydin-H75]MDP2538480.1 endolytic transglycosylase MltG [Helicobacter sp. faydin-H76]
MTKNIIRLNIFFDTILLIVVSVFFYLSIPIRSSSVIYMPQGSISGIITYLSKNNFDINQLDKYILRIMGKPQSGWIDIGSTELTKGDFLYKLTKSKAALQDITLIPGETMYFFIQDASKIFGLSEKSLWDAYHKYSPLPDGIILPNTYKLPLGISANYFMQYLLNQSMNKHKELAIKVLGEFDAKQWFRYVTMASIVQKEAADKEEMPIIAAVIYNRIRIGMPLQMDGSLNYGKYSHIKVTPERIKNDTTPYNTYKHRGVPPYPIGSASMDAILAVINPANVKYLYFVKTKTGKHIFSNTYKQHLKNVK